MYWQLFPAGFTLIIQVVKYYIQCYDVCVIGRLCNIRFPQFKAHWQLCNPHGVMSYDTRGDTFL